MNRLQIVRARGDIYRLLVLLYSKEPNLALLRWMTQPDFLKTLSELGIEFEKDFLARPEQEIQDEISEEYTRLFIGPGRHISPHESVHRDGEGLLWGDSTARVKAFIESSGLKYCSGFKGVPDHISVELEFMYRLVQAEAEAREKEEPDKLKKLQSLQRRFVDEHIAKWIPRFADKIAKQTRLKFYRNIAQLTKKFILSETSAKSCAH